MTIRTIFPGNARQPASPTPQRASLAGDGRPDWSQLAALNMMEDLVEANRALAASNQALQRQIAERAQVEDALREREAHYRALFETSIDAIILTHPDGTILAANPAACKLSGLSEQDLRKRGRAGFVDVDDPRLAHLVEQRERTGRMHGELALRNVDGGSVECEVSGALFKSPDGEMRNFVFIRNLSARNAARAERSKLEQQLHESRKMEALGTLASGVAHDFNNILAAILGNAALARGSIGGDHPALTALAELDKAGGRAKKLVQQILTYCRRQPQVLELQALGPLVDETIDLLRAGLPPSVRLQQTPGGAAPLARVDATRIVSVLMNLCTNAWQAMPDNTGSIDIGLDEITLDATEAQCIGGLAAGRHARLSVCDDGSGMDATTLARLFEPFFTTKPPGQGTGLGLSVVHGIVKSHDGAIAVTSMPGDGSCFTVYLPVASDPVATDAAAADPVSAAQVFGATFPAIPAPQSARASVHVLYLDDDEAMVFMVTRLLRRQGYRVSGFENAEMAVAAVAAAITGGGDEFDLVVTDLNMPGASGLDVARKLHTLRPNLPVVITSGFITDELVAGAEALGVRQVIYKPNTTVALCEAIHRLLDPVTA